MLTPEFFKSHRQTGKMKLGDGGVRPIHYLELGLHLIDEVIPPQEFGKNLNALSLLSEVKADYLKTAGEFLLTTKKGLQCIPFVAYDLFTNHLVFWLDNEWVRKGIYCGYEPVFFLHNVLITNGLDDTCRYKCTSNDSFDYIIAFILTNIF